MVRSKEFFKFHDQTFWVIEREKLNDFEEKLESENDGENVNENERESVNENDQVVVYDRQHFYGGILIYQTVFHVSVQVPVWPIQSESTHHDTVFHANDDKHHQHHVNLRIRQKRS